MAYYNIHSHYPSSCSGEVTIVNRVVRENGEEREKGEKGTFFSVGIHPWYIEDATLQMEQLKGLAVLPGVVAIGEAGLDKLAHTPLDIQQEVFIQQAALAEELQKPLIIHCVKAWEELLAIKKQFKPQTPWIIHGFRGKPGLAKQLIHQGFYLSFGEYFNPGSLQIAYPNRIFAETDDKDISIQMIYRQIASSLDIEVEKLASQIKDNVKIVFLFD